VLISFVHRKRDEHMKNPIDMNGEPSQANQESTRAESADNRVAGWYRDLKQ